MRFFWLLLVELLYLAISLAIAWALAGTIDITPWAIIGSKNARVLPDDFVGILAIYLAVGAVVFLLYAIANKAPPFISPKRTVAEIYAITLVTLISITLIFFLTTINFSLNFFFIAFISMVVLVLATHLVWVRIGGRGEPPRDRRLPEFVLLWEVVKSPFSWSSLAVILVFSTLLGLGLVYKRSGEVRNAVIQVRQYFAGTGQAQWTLEKVFPALSFHQPIDVDFSPSNLDEIYVLERAGRILRLSDQADSGKELVLDISDRVGEVQGENGAVGFALDPSFNSAGGTGNGFVYVYYTHVRPGSQHNRLSRFDISLASLEERRASESILIEQERSTGGSHNGGSVEFGPDGFLYLALGDASNAQNHQVIDRDLFSGIIRIDPHERGGDISHPIKRQPVNGRTQGYFIPSDNPFAGQPDVLEEFWAIGLRNPFRMAIDRETGDIWTGDVGLNSFEEVNLVRKGGNYQWPYMEGPKANPSASRPEDLLGEDTPPFHAYAHTGLDRVVIGGVLYRGSKFPGLAGRYIFADNFSGRVSALDPEIGPGGEPQTLAFADQLNIVGITSFKETPQGDVYLTTLGAIDGETGNVLRLAELVEGEATPVAGAGTEGGAGPVEVTFRSAQRTFHSVCAYCHGEEGRGDGPGLEASNVKAPDFTSPSWQNSRTDDFLLEVVRNGGAGVGLSSAMPPWEGALSQEEIEMLVQVLRSMETNQ